MNKNANGHGTQQPSNDNSIDIVSFDRRKRSEEIRINEEAAKEQRRKELMKKRRAERIRRAKIARIKGYCLLGLTAVGALCIIIGIFVFISKAFKPAEQKTYNTDASNASISEEETALLSEFNSNTSAFYTKSSVQALSSFSKMLDDTSILSDFDTSLVSDYDTISESFMFMQDTEVYNSFRTAVKNVPMAYNGYIWSEPESIKSSKTDGYLYDTNTSFINAVANICIAEGSTAFLYEYDTDTKPSKDVTKGMQIKTKLEKAVGHLFASKEELGIKFDKEQSLCIIYTEENNGTSSGHPSNRWHNFRFGYIDAYTNISFNKAMRSLVKLYDMQASYAEAAGNTQDAEAYRVQSAEYKKYADDNAAAFSEKFWDSEKQRFIGSIDKNGAVHDYGFVFLNLEAIEAGLATKEQQAAIFDWLDGKRIIDGDTSTGKDIYALKLAPRNTTLAAEDIWWDYEGGTLILSTNASFGKYYQNGGASLYTACQDVSARFNTGRTSSVTDKISTILDEYSSSSFTSSDDSLYDMSQSRIVPATVLKTVFGLSTDGQVLSISPDLSFISSSLKNEKMFGIKHISFAGNSYGFLFDGDTAYITAENTKAVRINLGGRKADTEYKLTTVQYGTIIDTASAKTDSNGVLHIAAQVGANTYIKVEKAK